MTTIEMRSVHARTVSFSEFVNMSESELASIRRTRVIPPVLGIRNLGSIVVFYRSPKFVQRRRRRAKRK